MAQLNVTELMSDPDFVDDIQLIQRSATINSLGENIVKDIVILNTVGSVQPASGKVLNRLPEALRVADSSSFWFKGSVVIQDPAKYVSLITFRKKRYQIQTVMDWSNFGEGYMEGTCVVEKPT